MLAVRILITVWLGLLASVATSTALSAQGAAQNPAGVPQAGQAANPEAEQAEQAVPEADPGAEQAAGHGEQKLTMAMSSGEIFAAQFEHSVPYVIFTPHISPDPEVNKWFAIYNVQPWQAVSLGLMLALFLPVLWSFKKGSASRLTRIMRGFCLWVRDDLVYAIMGKEEGRAFLPFFMFVFFFIMVQNTIGLIPAMGHGFPWTVYTATGTPYVTAALASITLGMMLALGMKRNGVLGFWKGLVPSGVPIAMWPMMLLIELVSLVVKPFALTIRLFANMLAGHLVIASAVGLVFLFANMFDGSALSYLIALPCIGLAIFIYIIEAFITLLQAYIFTLLSVTFVYQAMHQDH